VAPLLSVEQLSKYYAGLAALKEVSFDVPEGEIVGLIGPNGAGKTTLFGIIAGSQRPTSGRVFFRGRDFTRVNSFEAVQSGIARTHQIPRPFPSLTVLENVEVGLQFGRGHVSSDAEKESMEMLKLVGLEHAARMPASQLCVGDHKRLELARTLAARPQLLLCDEVCAGLTETEMQSILELLRSIQARGTTIIYVEHNLRAIMSVCRHVIVLNFGQKLAEGPPEAMQNNPAVVEAYLGRPR
jgi:branched-chain amino acid transport system ATP-binding protein